MGEGVRKREALQGRPLREGYDKHDLTLSPFTSRTGTASDKHTFAFLQAGVMIVIWAAVVASFLKAVEVYEGCESLPALFLL